MTTTSTIPESTALSLEALITPTAQLKDRTPGS
jgi:hypothetical protein